MNKKISSHHGRKGSAWRMDRVLKNMDSFAKEVPSFNIKGETRVTTVFGGFMTLAISLIVLAYSVMQAVKLIEKSDPNVISNFIPSHFQTSEMVNLNAIGFRFAFTLENYLTLERKDDPRYIKWFARLLYRKDSKWGNKMIPFHKCSAEDLAEFNPIVKQSQQQFKEITENAGRGFYCLDEWPDDLFLGGDKAISTYNRLDVIFSPCNYVHAQYGYTGDFIQEGCIADLKAQADYLGPLNVLALVNYERFDTKGYGEHSIVKEAKIMN